MKNDDFSFEKALYALAFILAVVLRSWHLGTLPLSDAEANLALRAINLSHGFVDTLSSDVVYGLLTGGLMALFGPTNLIARLIPALMGSVLVLVPWLFSKHIGRTASIVLAFWLALDPGLLAISRQADSTMIAIVLVTATIGLILCRQWVLAGVTSGLYFLAGPATWHGVIVIGLTAAFWFAFLASNPKAEDAQAKKPNILGLLAAFAITLIVVGTAGFTMPKVLSAAAMNLPDYLNAWRQDLGFAASLGLIGLGLTELPALILGLWQFFSGLRQRNKVDILLGVIWALATILAAFLPSRTMAVFAWGLLPLGALAARRLDALLKSHIPLTLPDKVQTVASLAGGIFLWLSLLGLILQPLNFEDNLARLRLAVFVVGIALWILVTILIGWGWSKSAAVRGNQIALGFFLAVFIITTSWRASGNSSHPEAEIWRSPTPVNADVLIKLVQSAGEWTSGNPDSLNLYVTAAAPDSVKWLLRYQRNTQYVAAVSPSDAVTAVITEDVDNPTLGANYRGERVDWLRVPAWYTMTGRDWLRWLANREAPLEVQQRYIFWLRSDAFPTPGKRSP